MQQDFDGTVLSRLPLAEAVLSLWQWTTADEVLQDLFARHRGACYEKKISFPLMVHLIADSLLQHRGSGRQSFTRARENQELAASLPAAYQKLGRMPLPLSEAFLAETTSRVREVIPNPLRSLLPKSLRSFEVLIVDGKVIKRVPRRLKALLKSKGGVLGGKALVAMQLSSGLAAAMATHADGEVNDAKLVPDLLTNVRGLFAGVRLYLADRQFCDLTQTAAFAAEGDHFLVRYHPKTQFCPDPSRLAGSGTDPNGRTFVEDWGWLGRPDNRKRRYVRRIRLNRGAEEELILITDLLAEKEYPAADLLEAYLARWGIERVFQRITEVFHLETLIGTTPEGTIFQLAFCLVIYNLIQVLTAYLAAAEQRPVATISTELLFVDVQRQLIALTEVVEPEGIVLLFQNNWTAETLRRHLQNLLGSIWTDRWQKAPPKKRQPPPSKKTSYRDHTSVYRILQEHRRLKRESDSG